MIFLTVLSVNSMSLILNYDNNKKLGVLFERQVDLA